MSGVEIIGYSERGIVNALLYEIRYRDDGKRLLNELLGIACFPFTDDALPSGTAKIFIEQSFSDFGDADAVIVIDSGAGKRAIFIEAKVKTWSKSNWSLKDEFNDFIKPKNQDGKVSSSNLFAQIYHKQMLIQHSRAAIESGVGFPDWPSKSERKIGSNSIVHKAVTEIKDECDSSPFYLMLIPDKKAKKFFDTLPPNAPDECGWNRSHCGYLTWEDVKCFCSRHGLTDTLEVFKHNKGQIY